MQSALSSIMDDSSPKGRGTAESDDDPRVAGAVELLSRTSGLTVPEAMRAAGLDEDDCQNSRKQYWIRRRLPGGAAGPDDPRVTNTVKLLARTTGMTLPKAMRAEGFNEEDCRNSTVQMRIRRRLIPNVNVDNDNAEENDEENSACDNDGSGSGGGGGPPHEIQPLRGEPQVAVAPNDPRVKRVVRLMNDTSLLTLPKAMRAEGFADEDCESKAKQMWIRRRLGKKAYAKGGVKKKEPRGREDPEESKGPEEISGSEAGSDPDADAGERMEVVEGVADIQPCERRWRDGGRLYHAVRFGRALAGEDDGTDSDDEDRPNRRGTSSAPAPAAPAPVEIRSAIFLYWEDARRFVRSVPRSAKKGAEHAAFDTFWEAEEYLLAADRGRSHSLAAEAEEEIEGKAKGGENPGRGRSASVQDPKQAEGSSAVGGRETDGLAPAASREDKDPSEAISYFLQSRLKKSEAEGNGLCALFEGGQAPVPKRKRAGGSTSEERNSKAGKEIDGAEKPKSNRNSGRASGRGSPATAPTHKRARRSNAGAGIEATPPVPDRKEAGGPTAVEKKKKAATSEKDNIVLSASAMEAARKVPPKPKVNIWDLMYDKLVQYKITNPGSVDIPLYANANSGSVEASETPKTSAADKGDPMPQELCRWCQTQNHQLRRLSQGHADDGRYHWSKSKREAYAMTPAKVEKLREAGFRIPPGYDEMYERLAAHRAATGAMDVDEGEDPELHEWTAEQIKMLTRHFRGEPVSLSDERISALKLLGFRHGKPRRNHASCVEDVGLTEKTWDSMLDGLLRYGKERGKISFPDETSEMAKPVRKLKWWLAEQRREYRKLLGGRESTLTARRVQRLNAAGIDMKADASRIPWEQRLESLREFVAEHGHCRPKKDHPLGSFVSNLRTSYRLREEGKQTGLTDERVKDLLEIGFEFLICRRRPQKERKGWEERFQDLVAFHAENGHTHVTKTNGPPDLARWVRDQRHAYQRMKRGRKTHMNAELALRLSELGFAFDASKCRAPDREEIEEASAAPGGAF